MKNHEAIAFAWKDLKRDALYVTKNNHYHFVTCLQCLNSGLLSEAIVEDNIIIGDIIMKSIDQDEQESIGNNCLDTGCIECDQCNSLLLTI